MVARIIYYGNLEYDDLPTASRRKKARMMPLAEAPGSTNNYTTNSYNNTNFHYKPATNSTTSSTTTSFDYNNSTFDDNNSKHENKYTNNYSKTKYDNYNFSNTSSSNNNNNFSGTTNNNSYNLNNRFDNNNTRFDTNNKTKYDNSSNFSGAFQFANNLRAGDNNSNKFDNNNYKLDNNYANFDINSLFPALKKYFGFTSFRGNQKAAIEATCRGLDTLILMPTGGGKSICYQLPAILTEGVTVVVSPLKSLIADQVNRLRSLNIKTSALFGETSDAEASDIYTDLRSNDPEHKLLYVTPEKINSSSFLMNLFSGLYERGKLARFVIDEAHCVSMWGSDFRPDYRKLGKLRDSFRNVPIMALTATAPPKVREDILIQLKMDKDKGKTFIQSFNRPNLKFEVKVKSKGVVDDITRLIRAEFQRQSGIIYCLSRKECEQIAEKLRERAITSAPYHAGLSDQQRKRVFQAWSDGVFQVVCATIAFGMGIDKSNVRFVMHYSVPKSIEGYYQEAGRAGRDGQFASCILYFSKSDLYRMKSMLLRGMGRKTEDKERDKSNLDSIIAYVDNKTECRRSILLHYLGEKFDRKDCISQMRTACDNCLAQQKRNSTCNESTSSVPSNYDDF